MEAEEIIRALENDPVERLRWRVFRETGLRRLSKRRLLLCACHMLLDSGYDSAPGAGGNPCFDMERFIMLSRGEER